MNLKQLAKYIVLTLIVLAFFVAGSQSLQNSNRSALYYSDLKPDEYSIVYAVIPDTVDSRSPLSPDNAMGEITQARIALSMEDILRYDEERPIEALIVHPSAFDFLDLEWTKQASRRGVVMVNVNGYVKESGLLRGDLCDQQSEASVPWGNYYLIVSKGIRAHDPAQQAEVERAFYEECKNPGGYTMGRASQGPLDPLNAELDVLALVSKISTHMMAVDGFQRAIANPDATATVPPLAIIPTATP